MRALASLKLTVGLLIVIAIVLSYATILESMRGTEAAQSVYNAMWFYALQGLFSLNIVAALWERWPRNRWRIGFVITHASMLLIFGGALVTLTQAISGEMQLWEGESARVFERQQRGFARAPMPLPFTVRLDAYEMDYYPGTMRPANFRSRVTLIEADGRESKAAIYMNHPLTHHGYTFFQSSYHIEDGREMTVLSVSKDPGMPIVFYGFYLLILGMCVVLFTRIMQFREAERVRAATRKTGIGVPIVHRAAIVAAFAASALVAGNALAQGGHQHGPPQVAPPAMVEALRRMPVQHDGREMPFDTQAREAVRVVTGQRAFGGIDPVAMVMGWQMDQHGWLEAPIIKVDAHVAQLVGAPGVKHVSFNQLLASSALRREIGPAIERSQADQPQMPGDKALLKLDERITVFDAYLRGAGIVAIPAADRATRWTAPANTTDPAAFVAIEPEVRRNPPPFYPSRALIDAEMRYNAVNPVGLAWWLLLPAAIAAGLTLERDRLRLRLASTVLLVAGFVVMTWGIAVRWQFAGRIPASNMYESMMFLGWGVGLFGVVAMFFKNRIPTFNAAAMSALTMFLLDRLPMDPFVHPMPPVLAGTPWLAIHVPIIMVSYSTFAIATFLAHAQLGVELFRPNDRAAVQKWADILYWYLMVGSILLVTGIITGSIWASESWGTYWGWDPKEVWSLVAFLAYMAILHARSDGQMGSFGVALWSIVGFWTILMTYLGVNFVLGTGMHSYGMGSSNIVRSMLMVGGAETLFLFLCWYQRASREAAEIDARNAAKG